MSLEARHFQPVNSILLGYVIIAPRSQKTQTARKHPKKRRLLEALPRILCMHCAKKAAEQFSSASCMVRSGGGVGWSETIIARKVRINQNKERGWDSKFRNGKFN